MHSDSSTSEPFAPSVLYVGADSRLPERIRPLLARQGIGLVTAADPVAPVPGCATAHTALIFDTARLGPDQTIKDYMDAVNVPGVAAPALVVIAHSRGRELRLQAMRADAAAFFVAPVANSALVERLVLLCRPAQRDTPRVLVVDDNAQRALLTERILTAAGCVVRTLTDARTLAPVGESFQPDLIMADPALPAVGGAELATVIRAQGDALRLVPILFRAVECDSRRQAEALFPGGAVFSANAIRPDLLVKTVSERIASMRLMRRGLGVADHLDPDTGLATRRHFMHCLERAGVDPDAARPGDGLLVVALDGAGRMNEQLGTGAADLVVDRIGRLIGERLGQADLAVRLDDYRHALLIRRLEADALRDVAQALCSAIAGTSLHVAGNAVTSSVSIGISLLQSAAGDALTLIARAERACAQAAAGGGNRTIIDLPQAAAPHDPANERVLAELVEGALCGIDKDSGFRILYQPMVTVKHQGLRYVEVMLHLAARDGTLIPAADFLPTAERTGRLAEIDRWLMLRSLAVLMQQCHTQPRLRLCIHQHLESLTREGWLPWLRAQILAHGLAQRRPILDLHLEDLFAHRHVAAPTITLLRKIGIAVCVVGVDDSPAVLELADELRPPFVKLSPGTAHQLTPNRLNDLVQRLRRNQAEVIASGIDSPALVTPVWASGVDYAQGAVIQAPLPKPVFEWGEAVAG